MPTQHKTSRILERFREVEIQSRNVNSFDPNKSIYLKNFGPDSNNSSQSKTSYENNEDITNRVNNNEPRKILITFEALTNLTLQEDLSYVVELIDNLLLNKDRYEVSILKSSWEEYLKSCKIIHKPFCEKKELIGLINLLKRKLLQYQEKGCHVLHESHDLLSNAFNNYPTYGMSVAKLAELHNEYGCIIIHPHSNLFKEIGIPSWSEKELMNDVYDSNVQLLEKTLNQDNENDDSSSDNDSDDPQPPPPNRLGGGNPSSPIPSSGSDFSENPTVPTQEVQQQPTLISPHSKRMSNPPLADLNSGGTNTSHHSKNTQRASLEANNNSIHLVIPTKDDPEEASSADKQDLQQTHLETAQVQMSISEVSQNRSVQDNRQPSQQQNTTEASQSSQQTHSETAQVRMSVSEVAQNRSVQENRQPNQQLDTKGITKLANDKAPAKPNEGVSNENNNPVIPITISNPDISNDPLPKDNDKPSPGQPSEDLVKPRRGDGSNGNNIFTVQSGDDRITIDNFGGVGRGSTPSQEVIAAIDMIRFRGAELTARNMVLNEEAGNLTISFDGSSLAKVTLTNFALENLDNLGLDDRNSIPLGNILFDGDVVVQDSFDIFNSEWVRDQVLKPNTVTFLNNSDNHTMGFENSNDVINGQGGNDTIRGLSGDDTIRGGTGNDILDGGSGINQLWGNSGSDTFVLSYPGRSYVNDFTIGEDRIGLSNGLSANQVQIEQGTGINAGSTLIRLNSNGSILMSLTGISANTLTIDIFTSMPANWQSPLG
jgi:hypothetical protein